jgi:RNA polymerase sigma factor (sigma-70 family)
LDDLSVNLVARWRSGDQQAAADLFRRYAARLADLARQRLPNKIAARVDAEDVVQSAYRSFFVAARDGRYVLRETGDLWRLLVGITLHKLHHQVRRHTADKRQAGREQPVADDEPGAPGREPLPDEVVALTDLLEQVLAEFDPLERRMIELRLQGYRLGEIATETGRCLHTVLRVVQRFRNKLQAKDLESPGG